MQINSKNYLLLKDSVGKAKPSTRDLPSSNHSYGKADIKDPEGVSQVTRSWKSHEQSKKVNPDTNFKRINKMCLKDKAINSKTNHNYRKEHNITFTEKDASVNKSYALPSNEFSYGLPCKPSTPIKKVLQNIFAEEAEINQNEKHQKYSQVLKPKMPTKVKTTKAYTSTVKANQKKNEVVAKSNFKLGRFTKIPPKTETYARKSLKKEIESVKAQEMPKKEIKKEEAKNEQKKVEGELKETKKEAIPTKEESKKLEEAKKM